MKILKTIVALVLALGLGLAMLSSCEPKKPALTKSGLDPAAFVAEVDGIPIGLYTLTNANGMEVCVTNFGGRIVSIMAPDRNGELRDVVLGFDNVQNYMTVPSDFGASIGRFANRIGGAQFELGDKTVQLLKNDGENCLHGGPKGWQYQPYSVEQVDPSTIKLTRDSKDGDMNFPGHVIAVTTYKLTDDNAIDITYSATTDAPTVINMTNHSYFNLSADPSRDAMDEILYINSTAFTPTDKALIPTGEIADIIDTPLDFRTPTAIGKRIDTPDCEPLAFAGGYDHNWILDNNCDVKVLSCKLVSPVTGIGLEVYTDQPGVQFYAGNFLDGTAPGKGGIKYPRRSGICLETQNYPDAPNHPEFPSPVLKPGETYTHHCIFKFTVEK